MELYYYFSFLDEYAVFEIPPDQFDKATMLVDEAYDGWMNSEEDTVSSQVCTDYIVEYLAEHGITTRVMRFAEEQACLTKYTLIVEM